MELKDFADKDPCYLIKHYNKHPDDSMFKSKEGKLVAGIIKKYVNAYIDTKEDKEKSVHEGTVEYIVCCRDENTGHYMDNTNLDQEQLEKFDLKEDDRVQYKISKDGNAEILGKIHIEKTIEKLS